MKVVRTGDSPEQPATAPIFIGTVHARPLISAEVNPNATVTLVRFTNGGKNKRHTHSEVQMLYITEGHGIVATDEQEHHVSAGDIAHVPAGEVHWHGAEPGKDMAHLSILPAASKTTVLD